MSDTPMQTAVEHTIPEGERDEDALLAPLEERQRNVVQMTKLAEFTVRPGLMRLPVKRVATNEESVKWTIDVEHPVEGEIRFHREKPTKGWETEGIVELLEWYAIHDGNPYHLQREQLYVAWKGVNSDTTHGWELSKPEWLREPEPKTPWRERAASYVRSAMPARPTRTMRNAIHFIGLCLAVYAAFMWAIGATTGGLALTVITVVWGYVLSLIVTGLLLEPGEHNA